VGDKSSLFKVGDQFGIRGATELVNLQVLTGDVFTSGRRMKAAVGAVMSSSEETASVLAALFAILLGTCIYESKVFERRLAEDEIVFAVCDWLTNKVAAIVLDLGLIDGKGRSGLGLRRVDGFGESILTVLDRALKGDIVDSVSGLGVDKVGGSGDTVLMVFDRGLQGDRAGDTYFSFDTVEGLFCNGGSGCWKLFFGFCFCGGETAL